MRNLKLVLVVSGLLFACGGNSSDGGGGGTSSNAAGAGNSAAGSTSGGSNDNGGATGSAGSAGSGSDTCASFTPCGGTPIGTWNIRDFCTANSIIMNPTDCAGAVFQVTSSSATGSITLNSDLTAATNVMVTVGESASLPASCFTQDQCTQFQTGVAQSDGVTGATCSYSASTGCFCSLTITSQQASSGTYTTSGTNVTLSTADADPETDAYCVSGNTLTIQNTDINGTVTTVTATK
ncbi:MAG TPA: hypothetical protein VK745_19850 [Polyangiaceae bacterium]|nr:hypothetical protein [Polyangiaceae bacterium]